MTRFLSLLQYLRRKFQKNDDLIVVVSTKTSSSLGTRSESLRFSQRFQVQNSFHIEETRIHDPLKLTKFQSSLRFQKPFLGDLSQRIKQGQTDQTLLQLS